jgi:hypothetical protein
MIANVWRFVSSSAPTELAHTEATASGPSGAKSTGIATKRPNA